MGILDEAIREHLELKRQHGADDSELSKLEDEAFGPPQRPGADQASDAAAEAPTEFMTAPEVGEQPGQRREPSVADLQEPPPPPEEQPAAEHEAVPEAEAVEPPPAPEEDERQAIAEQPTEHFDVEEELAGSSEPGPSDEELVEEEISEPRLAPVDPLAGAELEQLEAEVGEEPEVAAQPGLEEDEEEDEFWSEQRLSEELDQALDAPIDDSLADPAPVEEAEPLAEPVEAAEPEAAEEPEPADAPPPAASNADVLEDTPDFLEDAPEDDDLWFEQKPPKDFDFDD